MINSESNDNVRRQWVYQTENWIGQAWWQNNLAIANFESGITLLNALSLTLFYSILESHIFSSKWFSLRPVQRISEEIYEQLHNLKHHCEGYSEKEREHTTYAT